MKLEIITRSPSVQSHATPLLFVHGMWHGAWCWDEFFLPYFADAGYHVTALSLRGHAGSEGRIQGSSIMDYVHDVEQAAKTLPTPPVLIGHSMGGFIVQKVLERSSAPAGVLLAPAPPFGVWHGTWLVLKHSPLTLLKILTRFRLAPLVETPENTRWAFFSKDMPHEQLLTYHAKMSDESFRMYLDLLGLNLVNTKKIKSPLLVLGAREDAVISVGDVEKTAHAYSTHAEFFPGMAHDMMLEKDWKAVAERIVQWLKERGI
ncbi:MAG TPA: alpha/beta fold hydrolase [Flavobacteriales bacterium]|nr:alpha/beta fold hydrolase [Anaerolineales bacterium]HNO06262.1 alpha/beta fold hydrolase [Flavobacteriales bacterium]